MSAAVYFKLYKIRFKAITFLGKLDTWKNERRPVRTPGAVFEELHRGFFLLLPVPRAKKKHNDYRINRNLKHTTSKYYYTVCNNEHVVTYIPYYSKE